MTPPGIEYATLKIAMQLALATEPQSAKQLVNQHQSLLDDLPIENHAAAYRVADWLETLAARSLVAIVPPAQKRGPTRYRWLGAIHSVPTRHSSTGANP
jgi:hypothetical protein